MSNTEVATPWPTASRYFVAQLAFDSEVQQVFTGMRAVVAPARRALFQTEGHELDLEMRRDPLSGQVGIVGQVLSDDARQDCGWLRLSRAHTAWLAPINDVGEFRLDGLEPGAYCLEILYKDRLIEVPLLPL